MFKKNLKIFKRLFYKNIALTRSLSEKGDICLEQLKAARSLLNWSQEDLALESDIATSYLCEVEKGKRNPTLNVINRLAKAFGIKIEELFKGIDGDIG